MSIRAVSYSVPTWGVGVLLFADGVLIDHEPPRSRGPVAPAHEPAPGSEQELADRLVRYLGGEPVDFADLDLVPTWEALGLTPFTRRVLEAIRAIPRGATASYADIAAEAGAPRAARAAGTACARGPLALIVPYHRVIASDGTIGSYGPDGTGTKRRLLALEGVALAARGGR